MKNTLLKFAGLIFMLLLCSYGYAQKKTFIRDYVYQASERDSKVTARAAAVQEMQTLLLQEIGQAIQSEQTLQRLSVAKDGKETFSEGFSQKIMAITAGFVEMKILQELWNGKTYYIEAQMTVDPKEVSQRVAEALNSKQKEKELEGAQKMEREDSAKAERARVEAEKKELERQKKVEAKEKAMEEAKHVKGWYLPKALGLDFGFMLLPSYEGEGYEYVNVGIRYTKNISPNVGFDIFKLNFGVHEKGYVFSDSYDKTSDFFFYQLLTGIRFASNRFGKNKNMYLYSSLRAGVGWVYHDYTYNNDNYYKYLYDHNDNSLAIATELDVGIYFKRFFFGATVNHSFFNPTEYIYLPELGDVSKVIPDWGLRFGLDIGKWKPY